MKHHNDLFAAIDLGSNSFHMLMVQQIAGSVRIIAKVKRKVRLAAGLDEQMVLSDEAMARGWDCLGLFAERLQQVPVANVKIVATATLRLAANSDQFCQRAQEILGLPVEIISGLKEAEFIYKGVAATSDGEGQRLVIDIGGASTELILGDGSRPLLLNSLEMGCVTFHERYFADGLLSREHFERAITAANETLAPVLDDYLALKWQTVLGASGSVQAVQEVLMAQGMSELITLEKLEMLIDQTIDCGSQDTLVLKGLQDDRKPVFASGLAILTGLFRALGIQQMSASGGALREGLLAQLLDHQVDRSVRRHSCQSLQHRFQVDTEQAHKVSTMALLLAEQVRYQWPLSSGVVSEMLQYAGELHEIGLSIGYPQAHKHSEYILRHADMAGFSRQQRLLISLLVGQFRAPLTPPGFEQQGACSVEEAERLLRLLRLAVILIGRRSEHLTSDIQLAVEQQALILTLAPSLWQQHPLLMSELHQEVKYQAKLGWTLELRQAPTAD